MAHRISIHGVLLALLLCAHPLHADDAEPTLTAADAQDETSEAEQRMPRSLFLLTYTMANALGTDYIPSFSPKGISFGYRFHLTPRFAIGLLFSWQAFDTKHVTTQSYADDTMTIRGTQLRSRTVMPLVATAHYNFKIHKERVLFFVGLETGAYHVASTEDYPWVYFSDSQWHWGFAPEIGMRLARVKIPLYLSIKYTLMVPNSEQGTQSMLGYHIGLSWAR